MMIGLPVPGALLPALAVLTVLGGVTLAQRVWSAVTRVAALGAGPEEIGTPGSAIEAPPPP